MKLIRCLLPALIFGPSIYSGTYTWVEATYNASEDLVRRLQHRGDNTRCHVCPEHRPADCDSHGVAQCRPYYCSIGDVCMFQLRGSGFEFGSYFTIANGPCDNPESSVLMRVSETHQGTSLMQIRVIPTVTILGDTWICWSPRKDTDALTPAGFLHVGPIPAGTSCTLGVPCSVNISQYSDASTLLELSSSRMFVALNSSDSCDKSVNFGDRWLSRPVITTYAGSDGRFLYGSAYLGTPDNRSMVGNRFLLCWCRDRIRVTPLGAWDLIGPSEQNVSSTCRLGFPCDISIYGNSLSTVRDRLLICGELHVPDFVKFSACRGRALTIFTVIFLHTAEDQTLVALCWQAGLGVGQADATSQEAYGEEVRVGTVTLINECPNPSSDWPERDSTITLLAGQSHANLYAAPHCLRGEMCSDCVQVSLEGVRFAQSAYFVFADNSMTVTSCSQRLVCTAQACVVELAGAPRVEAGEKITGTAYMNARYKCQRSVRISVVAFGCSELAVTMFMVGVSLVLVGTVIIGLALEAVLKASVKTCLEGTVEIRCTAKEKPSFTTLRRCVEQSIAPGSLKRFDAWCSGQLVFVRFQVPVNAKSISDWVTEVPGLCRVDAASIRRVQEPARSAGTGFLELLDSCCLWRFSDTSPEEQDDLHFEFAVALLHKLRQPHVQGLLMIQYALSILTAVGLPAVASQMMVNCEDGYPIMLHCVWVICLVLQWVFQWWLLSRSCSDRELTRRFVREFSWHLIVGWFAGTVSQTDMYMDLTFPVIAKSCNFELWVVGAWLCALGIGIGQVGQSVAVIVLGRMRARSAASPERSERAELSALFFLLRVTDNYALCFAVRPAFSQRLGGSSSWAAKVAEARVPTARFLFEDSEQMALQVIFLMFFDLATASDIVWIALSITTSLLLSLVLMVQVLPEVRDWIWYRLLAVVRRRYRIPLLLAIFIAYRFISSTPWLFACSRFVADTTFLGLHLRHQVVREFFIGIGITTASLAVCCLLIYALWTLRVAPPPKLQPPTYDAEARFSPKAFGAWSTEQDQWLEPLRNCISQEVDPARRSLLEHLDNELFNLRHGLSSQVKAIEALNLDGCIPDAVTKWGQRVLGTARVREQGQKLLKNRSFTHAPLQTKSQMIDSMVLEALTSADCWREPVRGVLQLLPHHALKNGIPHWSDGLTVSVSQAHEQAGPRRIAVIAVSHCWLSVDNTPPHPDNENLDKARSLRDFADWYLEYWGNDIEVFYWIDYSCIDQDSRDISVALLPVLMASCTATLLWRSQEYERRSWTAMERVLSYSYCEGGLTPYVIDAQFANHRQEPRWEPRKLPNPLSGDSTASATSASDKHSIQQLLQCAFAVPAFELFPDRQSIVFGHTEVVHLDLTCREDLRHSDGAKDGFIDGEDRRKWIAAAERTPAVNVGMRVRPRDQVALLMPADVADTFVPICSTNTGIGIERTEVKVDLMSAAARFEGLLASSSPPSEMDVALLLEVLEEEMQTALLSEDEHRLIRAVDVSQNFKVIPPTALEARRKLCRGRLDVALKGSDRVLGHALQLAQHYGVDTEDFPEFMHAAAEQERRRRDRLHVDLEEQLREAERTRDHVLMFAVWQVANKASDSNPDFSLLANSARQCITAVISEKCQAPGVGDDADKLQSLLHLAARYGVEKSAAVEHARERLSVMRLDIARMKDAIQIPDGDRDSVGDLCHEVLNTGVATWILHPLLMELITWALEQQADELQEALRAVAILGFPEEDPAFKAGVEKLKEVMQEGLPDDWNILKSEWTVAHMAGKQVTVEGLALRDSIQALIDSSMEGHDASTCDRHGTPPTRLKVSRVVKVQHPGNYLRYKACREKMLANLGKKEGVQELGTVKTEAAEQLPDLVGQMELNPAVNEAFLFHGTNYRAVDSIAAQGFRVDMAGTRTGAAFGRGAYFAERCLKSDEYTGCVHDRRGTCFCNSERPLLICRVLLGKIKYNDDPLPDKMELERACLEGDYDSILADREAANIKRGRPPTYREFVVFDKDQVYPVYVVWYTRSFDKKPLQVVHPALLGRPARSLHVSESPKTPSDRSVATATASVTEL